MTEPKDDGEIFADAIALPKADQQHDFVRVACDGDFERYQRIISLLESHRELEQLESRKLSLLDRAGDAFEAISPIDDPHFGKQVGPFRIVQKLGEGGMGLVYAAQQVSPLQRKVALKLLKPGMDSNRVLTRFAVEQQVLQQMDHVGITRILDAGIQDNGRPYFAMELVEHASKLTDFAQQHRLTVKERIKLVCEVCSIVQHAHQRGVLHRDLKPSNVLVSEATQSPSIKVIDFGIAKALYLTNDSLSPVTTLGERMGTPAYMSPEQALRSTDIDIRSDVYSLGAILYELLTGVTPRRLATGADSSPWTSDVYWRQEIVPPSVRLATIPGESETAIPKRGSTMLIRNQLQGELDWITLKALAFKCEDRYQSVADLQRDLECHLAQLPVVAAGPSTLYRLRKFISRNRILTTAILSILFTVMATSVFTTWFAVRALRAEADANTRMAEMVRVQSQLADERDRATLAMRQSHSVLRTMQVHGVTMRAHSKLLIASINAVESHDADLHDLSKIDWQSINADCLLAPDIRLMIKGDWNWATAPLQLELELKESMLRMRSNEVAKHLPRETLERGATLAQTASTAIEPKLVLGSTDTTDARFHFQKLLLEELRNELPPNDPFIAEVLDNCALNAMDSSEYAMAEEFLQNAIHIWSESESESLKLIQSELFLVKCLGHQQKKRAALKLLNEVSGALTHVDLRQVDGNPSELAALQSFAENLRCEVAE